MCGEQPVERVGLGAQLLTQCPLGLDVALGGPPRAACAYDECREHAEGERQHDVQNDLVDAHVRSIPPCTAFTTR